MTDLKREKSYTTLTGKAKINDKSFGGVVVSPKTGYNYVRINLGVETADGNVVYAELMGGYAPAKPIIYAMNKADNTALEVNFADRLNPAIVESVSDFKLYKMGLKRDDSSKLIIEKYLSPIDVEAYLKENLTDGMEITVRGTFEFSEYNGNTQRKMQIQNIYLPYVKEEEELKYEASFIQTILLDEESFKKITPADAKEGEVTVSAYAVEYVGKKDGKQIKKNLPFTLPITVKINKENPELTAKILNALFKVKKGKVRELTIEGTILEGYEKQEVNAKDIELSAEIKELIAMGLYSEEEAMEKMTVRGNKVSKLVFTRPFIQKDKDDAKKFLPYMDDTKYVADDLIVSIEEEITGENLADSSEGSDTEEVDDNAWMSALGM